MPKSCNYKTNKRTWISSSSSSKDEEDTNEIVFNNIPRYSLLGEDEQCKNFRSCPKGHCIKTFSPKPQSLDECANMVQNDSECGTGFYYSNMGCTCMRKPDPPPFISTNEDCSQREPARGSNAYAICSPSPASCPSQLCKNYACKSGGEPSSPNKICLNTGCNDKFCGCSPSSTPTKNYSLLQKDSMCSPPFIPAGCPNNNCIKLFTNVSSVDDCAQKVFDNYYGIFGKNICGKGFYYDKNDKWCGCMTKDAEPNSNSDCYKREDQIGTDSYIFCPDTSPCPTKSCSTYMCDNKGKTNKNWDCSPQGATNCSNCINDTNKYYCLDDGKCYSQTDKKTCNNCISQTGNCVFKDCKKIRCSDRFCGCT